MRKKKQTGEQKKRKNNILWKAKKMNRLMERKREDGRRKDKEIQKK